MTADTCIMGFSCRAYQGIIMTAAAAAGRSYDNARMARIGGMHCFPRARMTGFTVGRGRVADGFTD